LLPIYSFCQTKPTPRPMTAEEQKQHAQIKAQQADLKRRQRLLHETMLHKTAICTHIDTSDFEFNSKFIFSMKEVDETNDRVVPHPEYGQVRFQEIFKVSSYDIKESHIYHYIISPTRKYVLDAWSDKVVLIESGKKLTFEFCQIY
jgi:hypothetical protein